MQHHRVLLQRRARRQRAGLLVRQRPREAVLAKHHSSVARQCRPVASPPFIAAIALARRMTFPVVPWMPKPIQWPIARKAIAVAAVMAKETATTTNLLSHRLQPPAVHVIVAHLARRLHRIPARLQHWLAVSRNPRVARLASVAAACPRHKPPGQPIHNSPDASCQKPCESNAASAAPQDRKNRHRQAVAARRKKTLQGLQAISPGKSAPVKPLADRP